MIHNSAKTYDILANKKFWKAYDLLLLLLKKMFFCFGCGPYRPLFCASWAQK